MNRGDDGHHLGFGPCLGPDLDHVSLRLRLQQRLCRGLRVLVLLMTFGVLVSVGVQASLSNSMMSSLYGDLLLHVNRLHIVM